MAPSRSSGANAATSTNKVAAGASSGDSNTTLIISSLPPKYTSDSLSTLLSSVGPIRIAFLVTDQGEDKRSKGYGFAKFVLKEDAEKAISELNGTIIDGKKISVQWAKRRQRVNKPDEDAIAPVVATKQVEENVNNAYAARRALQRAEREGVSNIDNKKDIRTVVLEGGLDTSLPENKKALQHRLKKVVSGINTGLGSLTTADLKITPSTVKGKVTDPESGEVEDIVKPITLLETPSPRAAAELAAKLHNTVLKGHLCLCKSKFESDLLTRKGSRQAVGRLIVRNLAFDVTEQDVAAVFAPFGFIQHIQVHRGFAFVWYLKPDDADTAMAAVNGKRIYAGIYKDRIEESANHKLSSTVRKEQKGRIVGVRGRIMAVDKALSKEVYDKLETEGKLAAAVNSEKPSNDEAGENEDSDESAESDGSDDEDDEEEEDEDDDLSPVELDDLEAPSDAEESEDDAKPQENQGTTLFVRNIQFEATEDELYALFKGFGPVKYARIVMDPVTKRSRGTGFVNFYREEDALKCLQESDRLANLTGSNAASTSAKGKTAQPPSLLTIDPSSSVAAALTLHGRVLGVSEAVSKGSADKLREERDRKGQTKDRRNLYLMHEGVILPDSPLAATLVPADLQARQESFEARRGLLRTNPSLYISRSRLAIRQIPLFVSEGMLRRLAGWAIKAFNTDVKAGKRSKLTMDELREPVDALGTAAVAKSEKSKSQLKKDQSKVRQVKILRQDDRVDLLTGQKRSKGYGFLELNSHADALRVIRWANGNNEVHKLFHRWWIEALKAYIATAEEKASKDAEEQARTKRMKEKLKELEAEDEDKVGGRQGKTLIIEFSIENAVTVKRRAEKVEKVRQRETKRKRDAEEEQEEEGQKEEQPSMAVEQSGQEEKAESRNHLGSMIGKKRKLAKQKRGGGRK